MMYAVCTGLIENSLFVGVLSHESCHSSMHSLDICGKLSEGILLWVMTVLSGPRKCSVNSNMYRNIFHYFVIDIIDRRANCRYCIYSQIDFLFLLCGRHVEPFKLKFRVKEQIASLLFHDKFNRDRCRGMKLRKLRKFEILKIKLLYRSTWLCDF